MSEEQAGRHLIVPIFITFQGCPHRCVFCQQEKITSQSNLVTTSEAVTKTLVTALQSDRFDPGRRPEVAFYGGTFTGLPVERMSALLGAVRPFLEKGLFASIRVSTRPDALDRQRLDLMKRCGVSTVELGVQSMDDGVLALSRRGHSARDTVESVKLLGECGFKVGIQLMPGLPGDSEETFLKTVETVKDLAPDMVRLYPAIVIRGTELARRYEEKRYTPWGLDETLNICKRSCVELEDSGIPVIRIGLMSSPSLDGEIVAGPWHNALGFLVRSAIHHDRIARFLPVKGGAGGIRLRVPRKEIPLVRGYQNQGLRRIEERCATKVVGVIPDDSVRNGQIAVDKVGERHSHEE